MGERGHVGNLIEGEKCDIATLGGVVGPGHNFIYQPHHHCGGDALMPTRRHNMKVPTLAKKLIDVERPQSTALAGAIRAQTGEQARSGRPDARSLSLVSVEDSSK
jgi:hypothetical protein